MRQRLALLAAVPLLAVALSGCIVENIEEPGSQQQQGQQNTAHHTPGTSFQKTSFDCAKASGPVENLICTDAELAGMDRKLADEYQKVLKAVSDKGALESSQRAWIAGRNDCSKAKDMRSCVVEAYQHRTVELVIADPSHQPALAVSYRCPTQTKNFTMQFYNNEKPQAALLTLGSEQAVLFRQTMGSGIKYTRPGVEYAEHQGEVNVDFRGDKFTCYTK